MALGQKKRSIRNILKNISDSKMIKIRHLYRNGYMIENNVNIFVTTNGMNPLEITDDNRRIFSTTPSSKHKGDHKFFSELDKEIKENIEILRGYYYTYQIEDLTIPWTETINNMMKLSTSFVKSYL